MKRTLLSIMLVLTILCNSIPVRAATTTLDIDSVQYPVGEFEANWATSINLIADNGKKYNPSKDLSVFIDESGIFDPAAGSFTAGLENFYSRFAIATAGKIPEVQGGHDSNFVTVYQATVDGYNIEVYGTSIPVGGAFTNNDILAEYKSRDYELLESDLETEVGLAYTNTLSDTGDFSNISAESMLSHALPYLLIREYISYATTVRLLLDLKFKNSEVDDEAKSLLSILLAIKDSFGEHYPILNTLWEYSTSGTKSLAELATEELEPSVKPPDLPFDEEFVTNIDRTSPIGNFYTINLASGVSEINKSAIWNDIETDTSGSDAVAEYIDNKYGINDTVNKEQYLEEVEEKPIGTTGSMDRILKSTPSSEQESEEVTIEVEDQNSTQAVTLSSYITEGMTYSSTYVPMKTNLYAPDVIANYSQEFRDEFFYKYGFMRKVVLWDKSASSVMDYYNAGDKITNTLEVVTLRDLIEVEDNEIALYVDDNFYNAETAIEETNTYAQARNAKLNNLANDLIEYYNSAYLLVEFASGIDENSTAADIIGSTNIKPSILKSFMNWFSGNSSPSREELEAVVSEVSTFAAEIESKYGYTISDIGLEDIHEYALKLSNAATVSMSMDMTAAVLKTGDATSYSTVRAQSMLSLEDTEYRNVEESDFINNDNNDTLVLPSSAINKYIQGKSSYRVEVKKDEDTNRVTTYETYDSYSPMMPMAYVSLLYRDADLLTLANLTTANNPVFLASTNMCAIETSDGSIDQWYANTLLNWALVKNLKGSAQIDYTYVIDLDCPLYIDIFGNISTESGVVVIPAASNMTLHPASYKDSYVASGLYSIYGTSYYVPGSVEGAAKAMMPFFLYDTDEDVYVINGQTITYADKYKVSFNSISPYDIRTQSAITLAYKSYIHDNHYTKLNWVSMVNIINEVMRGAPVENIDKEKEGVMGDIEKNRAGLVAAAKLEEIIKSFEGTSSTNTLLQIPDFSRMDHVEYIVAFLIKIMIVATTAVIIVGVYRDGVSGDLGLRTLWKSLSSVALTFSAIVLVPAIFQLTYYAANKYLLQEEAIRIIMFNQEKYNSGVEIGVMESGNPKPTTDMAIQLDWISVPWYEQLDDMLYGSSLQNLDKTKQEAYLQSEIYDNHDVTLYNDGVYTTIDQLFSSVAIDYSFNISNTGSNGESARGATNYLYMYADNDLQTASFFSPYYAFLTILVGNINEYNYYHDNYNYTTKYMSGNRLKTVGLCNSYFTSQSFMELDADIMHLKEIYRIPVGDTYDHGLFFSEQQLEMFSQSGWFSHYVTNKDIHKRIDLMNKYARDFIARNKDMLTKISDETFIKAMAIHLAVKYNQLFSIPFANAIEIYNMDSNDLLRLSIAPTDEAILQSPLSYSRFVYNYGGEPAVYAAAILTVIMWVGSFIKPACTVIVFISVFLSIWVFRVVLRKPSANILGYIITCLLLCLTNVFHAILLKVSVYLPNGGLSMLGCILFLIIGQVSYLLLLGYVTGVSLKDWSNLGYVEYAKEANMIRSKFGSKDTKSMLSGKITHHQDNWEYYNDLVKQHRSRNA